MLRERELFIQAFLSTDATTSPKRQRFIKFRLYNRNSWFLLNGSETHGRFTRGNRNDVNLIFIFCVTTLFAEKYLVNQTEYNILVNFHHLTFPPFSFRPPSSDMQYEWCEWSSCLSLLVLIATPTSLLWDYHWNWWLHLYFCTAIVVTLRYVFNILLTVSILIGTWLYTYSCKGDFL